MTHLQGVQTDAQLRASMETWGPTGSVTLARQPDTNKPKGFGFVEFKRSQHAEAGRPPVKRTVCEPCRVSKAGTCCLSSGWNLLPGPYPGGWAAHHLSKCGTKRHQS
eukprot:16795-Pelagomonas_calceolata.AAC.8